MRLSHAHRQPVLRWGARAAIRHTRRARQRSGALSGLGGVARDAPPPARAEDVARRAGTPEPARLLRSPRPVAPLAQRRVLSHTNPRPTLPNGMSARALAAPRRVARRPRAREPGRYA